uniref:BPH_2 domain-containing protein n=1 Tax=Panagrellus redivivus TaxID=6233 RepID=A0A7E4ZU68_PANRE
MHTTSSAIAKSNLIAVVSSTMSLKREIFVRKLLFGGRVRTERYFGQQYYEPEWRELFRNGMWGPRASKLTLIVFDFDFDIARFRSYLYWKRYVFSGKVARLKLTELAGQDADYVWAFLFKQKVVRKVGFGKFDGTLSDDVLYCINKRALINTQDKLRVGKFPEEVAYIARHAIQQIGESRDEAAQETPES